MSEAQCITRGCNNPARYDEKWCGCCDITYNLGRGKRRIDMQEPRPDEVQPQPPEVCAEHDGRCKPYDIAHHRWFYGHPAATLQRELASWQRENFGEQRHVKRPDLLLMFCGMVEELGELAHAILKYEQGIRGLDEDTFKHDAADALADGRVFGTQFATGIGICEQTNFEETARNVMRRDWKRYPKNGLTE